jgi:hypothetical protein
MLKCILTIAASAFFSSLFAQREDSTYMEMTSAHSLSLPMSRDGSGTGWQPDEAPMYAYMLNAGKWNLMLHGAMFLRYDAQNVNHPGKRGNQSQVDAPNWMMLMAQRKLGKNGLLSFNGMFSIDALVMGGSGYPLLFQTGESWKGQPLVDRQHPHDLFAELSIAYAQRINSDMDVYGYCGLPGEPGLGPVTFMHRASAITCPDAPLGHHWQDATHITFGVGTIGFRYKIAKIEASIFTGREPDENRYDFDLPRFDSYAYRVSVNPHKSVALQFSQGFIHSPEALEPAINVMRTTASIQHVKMFNDSSFIATSFVYGLNTAEHSNDHSLLVESNYLVKRFDVYGRYEFVQKNGSELNLSANDKFNIHALTLGADYKFFSMANLDVSLGLQGSAFLHPAGLDYQYGKVPISYEVFFKINPSMMKTPRREMDMQMDDMKDMKM